MNTFSLRWLFVAVAGTALAVTAILNANTLWKASAGWVLIILIGVAAANVVSYGRDAPFAAGFAIFAALAYWIDPNFDLGTFLTKETYYWLDEDEIAVRCLAVACGCAGGFICRHLAEHASGRLPSRLSLALWLLFVAVCSAAVIGATAVAVNHTVSQKKQEEEQEEQANHDLFSVDPFDEPIDDGHKGPLD